MKSFGVVVIFFLTMTIHPRALSQTTRDKGVNEILELMMRKINSYETISYNYYRSINYFSENYHSETNANTIFDFTSEDTIIGFKYQFDNDKSKLVFNGTENFSLNKKEKSIKVNRKSAFDDFTSLSFFVNSFVTLKRGLPAIISDERVAKTLTDTSIDDKVFYLASFTLSNKTISGLGSFTSTTITRDFFYKIVIDKETFLPLHVIQTNNAEPKDFMLTSFTEYKSVNNLPELSWYSSTYADDYKPTSEQKLSLVKVKSIAPNWESVYFDNNSSITLNKLRGHVVLLEFWIKNCGYCIVAVPKLNDLIKKYGGKKLKIVGINMHDSKSDMENFYLRTKPKFKTAYDRDGKITNTYGVTGFPTVVLIDRKGSVLYAGDFDYTSLESLIQRALK